MNIKKLPYSLFLILLFIFWAKISKSQENFSDKFFKDIIIKTDTASFSFKKNSLIHANQKQLAFNYSEDHQIAEFIFLLNDSRLLDSVSFTLLPSPDFEILDSLMVLENAMLRTRLKFKNISETDFLSLILQARGTSKSENFAIRLFPHTQTKANIYLGNDDFYVGEEKRIEIITNRIENLVLSGEWIKSNGTEYRLSQTDGKAFIDIVSHETGNKNLTLHLSTKKPFVNSENKISYTLEPIELEMNVRASRLSFLRIDQREIIRTEGDKEGVEIQLDNHRNLQVNKTYRIEDREEKGGPLIAELYTLRRLSNEKVLCVIRPYQNHRVTQGYLYIKDGDLPLFLTNINIIPDAKIFKISILKQGKNWTENLNIKPGEIIDLKIEGISLDLARFYFEDLEDISSDTLTRNERVTYYRLKVPIHVRKQSIQIFNNNKLTGFSLNVIEHQRPRPLDFVYLNYGESDRQITYINQPIFYNKTIREMVISFDDYKIDQGNILFGKQFLELEIRVTGTRDELIEMQKIDFIEICPAENSPRHAFYTGNSCNKSDIRINSLLNRKTHSLDEWSKIELTIRHKNDKYQGDGYTQKILIVMQHRVTFDVDLSFPAGLLIKKIGDNSLPGLSGISLAMLAQFSFYEKDKIRRYKPYKIGAGFLAQNAFNFNANAERDLGLIILGSVYPSRKEKKLSFPLYGGFGYFLNENKFFYLIGPGIRVNF